MVVWNCTSHAQGQGIKVPAGGSADYAVLEYREREFTFRAEIGAVQIERIKSDPGFIALSLPGFVPSGGDPGQPAMPLKSFLFEADARRDLTIRITHLDSAVIDLSRHGFNEKILPVIPSARKDAFPKTFRADPEAYSGNDWTGPPVFSVEYGGAMRGMTVSTLHFCPLRYHPATHRIKVYYNVRAVIGPPGGSRSRPVPSPDFNPVFDRVVRRQDEPVKKAVTAEEPMTMVILSDTMFRKILEPFVRWKEQKGFRVVEAYLQDRAVGRTRDSIKAYLKGLYVSPPAGMAPPTYLLIVGDVEQVPLSGSGGQITDLYYAEYDGAGDYIPDVFYGRISVALPGQLRGVLDKILEYEQYRFPDPSFLDEAVLIAGVDGTYAERHGNGQINYAGRHYLNPSNGILAHSFLYPESDTSDRLILDLVSRGVGFVNYTGHGLYDRWINPAFHQNDIEGLENKGKYPVMIGNGCETNIYTLDECFAEALVRTPDKGALAYIGCTGDSYWDEDYYWAVGVCPILSDPPYDAASLGLYDRVFHTHGESREQWTPSLGEMIFGGNLAVQESSSPRKKYYWEIYQLMGDPSLVPWFGQPATRQIGYPAILPPGSSKLDITCAPYDYVALSTNGQLLDARHAGYRGSATLYVPDSILQDTLDLVISGDRYRPFAAKVVRKIPEYPYLDLVDFRLSDESVKKDHRAVHNESFSLDLKLVNRGSSLLKMDTLVITTGHPDITVVDSMAGLGPLEAGDSVMIEEAFRVRTGNHVRDQEPFVLLIRRKGDPSLRKSLLKEIIHAPVLVSEGIRWDDRPHGNGNGIADTDEMLTCQWELFNPGHYRTGKISGRQVSGQPSVFKEVIFREAPSLEAGQRCNIPFMARLDTCQEGTLAGPFLAGDGYVVAGDSFYLPRGRHFEDFSGENPGRYPFENSSAFSWRRDTTVWSTSPASLRSGPVPDYGSSDISIRFENTGYDTLSFSYRVSSESGYDFFKFFVDDVEISRWSGEQEWKRFTYLLQPGSHQVTWSYRKDLSLSRGSDAAWIDDVVFPESAFRKCDLSLMEISGPLSGPWLGDRESLRMRLRNTGEEPVTEIITRIRSDGVILLEDTAQVELGPGGEIEFSPEGTVDLSGFGQYTLHAEVIASGDRFPGNNTLEHRVIHYEYPDLGLDLVRVDSVKGVYAKVVVAIENLGNIRFDSASYEVLVDGEVTGSGRRYLGLDPGRKICGSFHLMDSLGVRYAGAHAYLVRSLETDSVPSNNQVSGIFYWDVLGTGPAGYTPALTLFPNPASEGFHLVLAQPASADLTLHLYHSSGQRVRSYVIRRGEDRIYLGNGLPPGHYLLECAGTGITLHLVKTR
mgnify:CR=1 FL=1